MTGKRRKLLAILLDSGFLSYAEIGEKLGMRVLIIDPTGEWISLIPKITEALRKNGKAELSTSSHIVEAVQYTKRGDEGVVNWKEREPTLEALRKGNLVVLDISFGNSEMKAKQKLRARYWILEDIQETLMNEASKRFVETKTAYGYQTCIVLEEAHEFIPQKCMLREEHDRLNIIFAISTKEYRKYGLGHIFIDQSLKAISEDVQIQSFLLGSTITPSDVRFLETQLGEHVVSAVQRTAGSHSWVAFGWAAPMVSIPWEIDAIKTEDKTLHSTSTSS